MPNLEDHTSRKQERVRFIRPVANCEGSDRSEGSAAWVNPDTAKALIDKGDAIPYDHDLPQRDNPINPEAEEGSGDAAPTVRRRRGNE